MLQDLLSIVSDHPGATTGAGLGVLILSEALGFTKKGGILKALLDLVIAAGAAASAFKKARRDLTADAPPYDEAFEKAFLPRPKAVKPPKNPEPPKG